jgi:hypothetical protein
MCGCGALRVVALHESRLAAEGRGRAVRDAPDFAFQLLIDVLQHSVPKKARTE